MAEESKGAPLFTVSQIQILPKSVGHNDVLGDNSGVCEDDSFDVLPTNDAASNVHEDDWQFL